MNAGQRVIAGVGVGIIDKADLAAAFSVEVATVRRVYRAWITLVTCAYSEIKHQHPAQYADVEISPEFLVFEHYFRWWLEQPRPWADNWVVSKDAVLPGNRVFSPENCAVVPRWLNAALTADPGAQRRHLPRGVWTDPYTDRQYRAVLRHRGKRTHLGRFTNPNAAAAVYRRALARKLEDIAAGYFDARVAAGLRLHADHHRQVAAAHQLVADLERERPASTEDSAIVLAGKRTRAQASLNQILVGSDTAGGNEYTGQ